MTPYLHGAAWVWRILAATAISLVVMLAATTVLDYAGGDDRAALVVGGVVWGYLLCRWRVI